MCATVDDLCFLHGMHTEGVAHGPATLFLHTGSTNLIRPSMGSWITYGLGDRERKPAGVRRARRRRWATAARAITATRFCRRSIKARRSAGAGIPAKDAQIRYLLNTSARSDCAATRSSISCKRSTASKRSAAPATAELEAVIDSYELAFRMQRHAPEVLDLAGETQATLDLYGIGAKETDDYGRQCLMARRLAESGVRYIQVNYTRQLEQPGLGSALEHAEARRARRRRSTSRSPACSPTSSSAACSKTRSSGGAASSAAIRSPQNNGTGRDHNPDGFTVWLAGGGVKAGFSYGATDEFGHVAVEQKVHMHDLHATILHLLGLDHKRLTYRYSRPQLPPDRRGGRRDARDHRVGRVDLRGDRRWRRSCLFETIASSTGT